MWKSGFSPRGTTVFFQHQVVDNYRFVHRGVGDEKWGKVINRKVIHNPQGLWKDYRLELMLAVMSRILF